MNAQTFRPLLVLLLPLCLLPACKPDKEISEPVLLRINGHTVSLAEFRREFSKTLPADQPLSSEERMDLERSYLIQIIDRRLALGEADRLGVTVSAEESEAVLAEHRRDYPEGAFEAMLQERGITLSQWGQSLAEWLLIEKVARKVAYGGVSVTEEEIASYYQKNRPDFARPAQARARQIVVGGREEGEEVLRSLRGGEPFAEVARRESLSPDAEQGGDLGFFGRGEMPPEFEAVVFALPVGKISDLVRSEYGFHIFLVEESRPAIRFELDDVREEIRELIRAEKEEEAYQEWLQGLRGRAAIEVNWSLL